MVHLKPKLNFRKFSHGVSSVCSSLFAFLGHVFVEWVKMNKSRFNYVECDTLCKISFLRGCGMLGREVATWITHFCLLLTCPVSASILNRFIEDSINSSCLADIWKFDLSNCFQFFSRV